MTRIAIVGMGCRYPDATSPRELWENALAGRRAFRQLPDVRMRLEDYWDADPSTPDRFYTRKAAVIEGYQFDRIAHKIAGSTYRSTDLTHWLALDIAGLALADAGFPMGEGLPRERTGVVVGNSLTGEFTRANQLRLRWPYVRRTVLAALKGQKWDDDELNTFLDDFEVSFKSPFPPVDEDTLAGALSNTIAGRICNYFDLHGGGYAVDGACASSLLSVTTACKALIDDEIDVAVAGGVDLSIDPFEIIGFAKTGALATSEMRIYDRRSNGFWPGEGCGMVVLMREPDALEAGHRIYASVAGWGISSDGKGGITRPAIAGYQLALRRAYERCGFGIDTVALFEGHGTGTQVGDATELTALARARRSAAPGGPPATIGSIKGMIGHTKAAAGVAGLIKTAMAVRHEVLPPALGCVDPHEVLAEEASVLRVLRKAEPWPSGVPVRAAVTAMGFGGINTHVVLDNPRPRRRNRLDSRTMTLASSAQDSELLLLDDATAAGLRERLEHLIEFIPRLAYAQLSDLAAALHRDLQDRPYRAAVIVSTPDNAVTRLRRVADALDAGETTLFSDDGQLMLGQVKGPARIGFLFPGQGLGNGVSGGALRRRFVEVDEIYRAAALPASRDTVATQVAQPRVVTGSLAALQALSILGIEATVAVGHSLGEIAALHWAGVMDGEVLLRVARLRGATMAGHSLTGTMASISAAPETIEQIIADLPVVIAAYNGPNQTVIAGPVDAVTDACAKASGAGLRSVRLAVSHAFHSPLVAPAVDAFAALLANEDFGRVGRRVISTVTGEQLAPDTDVVALLRRQIVDPVLFSQAVALAAKDVDLFVEVGPGRGLASLSAASTTVPAVSIDTDDESMASLLRVVGAAYVVGACRVDPALFHGRLIRPLQVGAELTFFASPCESAPPLTVGADGTDRTGGTGGALLAPEIVMADEAPELAPEPAPTESTLDLLRRISAERAELPAELVHEGSRLLDDLHLSSITVGQVVNQVARRLGLSLAQVPVNFATATVRELADALTTIAETAVDTDAPVVPLVAGAAPWARAWRLDFDEMPVPARLAHEANGQWQVYGEGSLVEPLRLAIETANVGSGVLVCLPEGCEERHLELALRGAQSVLGGDAGTRLVLLQDGRGAAGLAKTLRLEAPHLRITIVHTPMTLDVIDRVVAEVAATAGFVEVYYDHNGVRHVPTLRAMPVRPARTYPALDNTDVLLVTGGGKGITAECALAVAVDSGAKLAILGRSDPATDDELAANLKRMTDAGLAVSYVRADVSQPEQVRRAVHEVTQELGPVTSVLHGSGLNEPIALTNLDMAAFRRTFAPKIDGLDAVLAAVDPAQVRLLVTFGSIIGRAGLRGEAHYATANEWLAERTVEYGQQNPHCRTLCLEWSVWSGVGMGERLSVVESLIRDGITPITPERGVDIMRRVLDDPDAPTVVVVSGRVEGVDTVQLDWPAMPLLRFVGKPLVRYHGVELVSEVELSGQTDLYLPDHLLDGNMLFPAVFGLEAMAQVAAAVTGSETVPTFEQVELMRPIVVPPDGSTTIQVAAVVTDDDTVDAVIFSGETNFAAEHFRARLRYAPAADADGVDLAGEPEQIPAGLPPVPLDPVTELYADTLFQGSRFQRLRRYHRAAARQVDVEVAAVDVPWFASYLPDTLILGDPGVRDSLMHGNQVCVPHATLLPAGIERVYPAGAKMVSGAQLRFCASERSRDGDTYVYDVALRTDSGEVVERWAGLRLRAVRKKDGRGPWVAPLLGPFLERSLDDLLRVSVSVVVEPDGPVPDASEETSRQALRWRRGQTALAAGRALGRPVQVQYRPDGRPEVSGERNISAAHGAGVTLCVAAADTVACDIQPVEVRSWAVWQGLLAAHADLATVVASETGESLDTAATRVWAAVECLAKAGRTPRDPLFLSSTTSDGWTVFSSGELLVAVFTTTLREVAEPVVCAVAVGRVG
ncbi:MAG: SDR family NAD(P)-dependent oxidoreductase [Micromonosporaceae bacterium]